MTDPAAGPVLGLEASSSRPGVALLDASGAPLDGWTQAEGVSGTAALAAATGALLERHGLGVADLLGVAVGTGPGSYTGLRAAIALARAMTLAAQRPLVGVPSVAAAARASLTRDAALTDVVVLLDARRGELYRADYRREGEDLAVVAEPHLVPVDAPLPAESESVAIVREPLPDAYDVAALGRARLATGGMDPAGVRPLYLKRAHAEIAWEERQRER